MNTLIEAMHIIHSNDIFYKSLNTKWDSVLSHSNEEIEHWIGSIYDICNTTKSSIIIKISTIIEFIKNFPNDILSAETISIWYFISKEMNINGSIELEKYLLTNYPIVLDDIELVLSNKFKSFIQNDEELEYDSEYYTISADTSETDSIKSDEDDISEYTSEIKSKINEFRQSKMCQVDINDLYFNNEFNNYQFKLRVSQLEYNIEYLLGNYRQIFL